MQPRMHNLMKYMPFLNRYPLVSWSLFWGICVFVVSCRSAQPPPPDVQLIVPENPSDRLLSDARFRVLVFSHTTGFRHTSIPDGIAAVQNLGKRHGFAVDATEDSTVFTTANLQRYQAVVFMNTNGDVLGPDGQAAFESYIQNGGGYVGVHSAAASEYDWEWYGGLVGAWFEDHPVPQNAVVQVLDRVHPSTAHLPQKWSRFDEWYNYRLNPRGNVHILATLDEKSYEGGKMGHDHPIAWAHIYDGGRAWYTGLGHTAESFTESRFLQHLLGGIEWAVGLVEGDVHATLASSYQKTVLMDAVTDPMELAIAEDGRVFVAERAGAIKMWDPETGETTLAGWIPVYMVIEDGLLGITLDPDFMENGWFYIYYAPADAGPSRLSRFTLVDNKVDIESEKILLEVEVQRKVCCHAAGSLTFDPQGNLYLSTGDNTDPSDREGSPIDERPGRENADDQAAAGNTNDLRGKILRIHPESDGTYSIPEGNLFAGDDLHRPEIYTMGHRNPFRISIDPKTGWVYAGDVGNGDPPNARGGWGWDEFNQIKGPGFYGWPYFTGDNQPYNDYNYETGEIGEPFNADTPVNDSPHNTGAQQLPPAQPAMIWYTYGASEDFPEMGAGGINPMAGPVFHSDPSHGPTALPAYFNGSIIIYEWMRNWVMEVKLDENGDLMKISPFLPGLEFVRPMDMELGPEGALYVIEWGDSFWGSNANAQVVRVDYRPDGKHMEMTKDNGEIAGKNIRIQSPENGSFFAFDEPLAYSVSAPGVEDEDISVHTYSGFDTHALLLESQTGSEGQTTITHEFTHIPNLHFTDRFAEIEACYEDSGTQHCDRVKLHPHHKEAEHIAWKEGGERKTHGLHPASELFELTALITMQIKPGEVLAYAPINLDDVASITLRYKQYEAGRVELRTGSKTGKLLASIDLDESNATSVSRVQQALDVAEALTHDEALQVDDLNEEAYENWSEVTVPVEGPATTTDLVLVFEGSATGLLLELDWLRFNPVH